jgi:hypothetical protein
MVTWLPGLNYDFMNKLYAPCEGPMITGINKFFPTNLIVPETSEEFSSMEQTTGNSLTPVS